MTVPRCLTIAGSDSGGGAGIQADLKTFSALGVYGATIITAVTAQNTLEVAAIHDIPPAIVTAQIDAVFSDLAVDAVKIGMLSRAPIIEAVADGLLRHRPRFVVLDPVMVSTSGDRLLADEATDALRRLLPRVSLVTPNLPEAAALLDAPLAASENEMVAQGRAIIAKGAAAVLITGGHAEGPESVDLLVTASTLRRFGAPRLSTKNTHGTGCTLSAAIAAFAALGLPLERAVEEAKTYVSRAIAAADRLAVGRGRGPVHHFHHWWQP
jgi:hydroxymethylpyrimidine/phosphomethylpyrimidine kinase